MLLSSSEVREYIKQGKLVQDMLDESVQIQQAGVDLTAAKVFTFVGEGVLDFSNAKRRLPQYKEISSQKIHDDEVWRLEPGTYHIAFNEKIILPNNIAALLVPRSSALVCGIVQHSALWDPGYEGRSFFHVDVSRPVVIHKNARLAQIIFFRVCEGAESYNGRYKNEDILQKTRN